MSENKIKIAVAGVGNLTSALVQAIEYYKDGHDDELIHPNLGGFKISDIEIVAAFDVDDRKVNKDISEAIFAAPNNKEKVIDVNSLGVKVMMGPLEDGLSEYTDDVVIISKEKPVDVLSVLKETSAELLILNTPSGSQLANKKYVEFALAANMGLINCTPSNGTIN